MPIIYLLRFNNYYNRIVKKFDTLNQYLVLPYYDNSYIENNLNFNPNDGVDTQYVMNNPKGWVPSDYDYLIYSEDGLNITSRWFITEATRTRQGQYKLTLRRDLVVDNYDIIVNADTFIEKAILPDTNPLIFNKEQVTVNQIKTSEELLKDETGVSWVVGYVPSNSFSEETPIKSKYAVTQADYTFTNISDFPLYGKNTYYTEPRDIKYYTKIKFTNIIKGYWNPGITSNGELIVPTNSINDEIAYSTYYLGARQIPVSIGTGRLLCDIYRNFNSSVLNSLNTAAKSYTLYKNNLNLTLDEVLNYNGKIIKDSTTGLFYKCTISKKLSNQIEYTSLAATSGIVQDNLDVNINKNLSCETATGTIEGTSSDTTYTIESKYDVYSIKIEQAVNNISVTLSSTRNHLLDQPYDMFCIPYGELDVYRNGTKYITTNAEIALAIGTAIGEMTGAGNIYDIQLLPYCPVRNLITDNGQFDIGNLEIKTAGNGVMNPIFSEGNVVGIICWASNSSFTFNINKTINIDNVKLSNECDLYRLVSPNYNGQFEFNAARNGGINYFNVDCSYKPFNPYIHINPNFNLLYGSDFNDARGLICGGDFSLPQISNAWANYQLSNKNYQNIFNRQIENMEVTNKYQNIQSLVSGAASALTAGVTAGAVFGPIGGLVSGLASAGAAGADYAIQKALQNEALDYTKDMFGYQLGNIQAMPNSITKTSAFTFNNKIFPILEYYTCTQEEKDAITNKIAYNSMSVGKIGKLKDYIGNKWSYKDISSKGYIKGKVIRLEGINEDANYLNEIANEIYKGVYI